AQGRDRAADPPRSAAGVRSTDHGARLADDGFRASRRCTRGISHREPQARRRRHQPGRVHRRAQRAHQRRAESQPHSLRRPRAARGARIRDLGRRPAARSGGLTMRIVHLFLMTACATFAAGCNSAAKNAPLPPTPVRVARATSGPAAPSIRTNGVLANRDEIRLAFKVGGVIQHLAVSEGEPVRKGQKLAEIEQTEVNAQVEQARQACEKANRDVARGERLYADKVISLEQLQDLRTQAAMAEAALNSARFNWSYAAIVAPRDGTVLRRLAEEREVVAAGAPVLVVGAQDRGFVVRTGLADREIVQVRIGDAVHVRLDALPDAKLDGKVTEIASAADRASGMFGIEVAVARRTELPLK